MPALGLVHTFDELAQPDRRLGRKVANHGLVTAALRYSVADEVHLFIPFASALGPMRKVYGPLLSLPRNRDRVKILPAHLLPQAVAQVDYLALHTTDPDNYFTELCHLRNRLAVEAFPVTCTTHTLSYWESQVKNLYKVLPGVMPWDAVFCTSRTARDYCREAYDSLAAGLRDLGLAGAGFKGRLELLPLGVEAAEFQGVDRHKARQSLGLEPESLNLLYLGRINPGDKADLMPLVGVAAKLAKRRDLRLMLAGAASQAYAKELLAAADSLGLAGRVHFFPDFDSTQKKLLLGAADIFVSPADNLQETFGLSILEAMAAGLPVVAAAFSGYRDLVLEGETGFLIPTLGPASFEGLDQMRPVQADHVAALQVAQRTAMDTAVLLDRLERLLKSQDLRISLGRAGGARVAANFDWPVVMARMEQTWRRLKDGARREGPPPEDVLAGNLRHAFGHFAESALGEADVLLPGPLAREMPSLAWAASGSPDLACGLPGGGAVAALRAVERSGGRAGLGEIKRSLGQASPDWEKEGAVLRALKLGLLQLERGAAD